MKCDFDYCIYNKELACILESIQINSLGMCEECMMVTIPDGTLESLKKEQLILDCYRNDPV